MSTLLYGMMRENVPVDQNTQRRNTAPVDNFAPPAEQLGMPDPNEVEVMSEHPVSLANTTLASEWHEGEQYAPFWQGQVDTQDEHNAIVDRQVSSSGTAAAREAAGTFGHGTMKYAVGIEPVGDLGAAGGLGNDYFVRNDRDIQEPAGNYMSIPPGYDQDQTGHVSAQAYVAAREASSNAYSSFYSAVAG